MTGFVPLQGVLSCLHLIKSLFETDKLVITSLYLFSKFSWVLCAAPEQKITLFGNSGLKKTPTNLNNWGLNSRAAEFKCGQIVREMVPSSLKGSSNSKVCP